MSAIPANVNRTLASYISETWRETAQTLHSFADTHAGVAGTGVAWGGRPPRSGEGVVDFASLNLSAHLHLLKEKTTFDLLHVGLCGHDHLASPGMPSTVFDDALDGFRHIAIAQGAARGASMEPAGVQADVRSGIEQGIASLDEALDWSGRNDPVVSEALLKARSALEGDTITDGAITALDAAASSVTDRIKSAVHDALTGASLDEWARNPAAQGVHHMIDAVGHLSSASGAAARIGNGQTTIPPEMLRVAATSLRSAADTLDPTPAT